MEIFQAFTLAAVMWILTLVSSSILVAAVIIYVVLRGRDARQELHDPQLGLKLVVNLLLSISIFLLIVGSAMMTSDFATRAFTGDSPSTPVFGAVPYSTRRGGSMQSNKFPSPTLRTGFGLAVSGLLLTAIYSYLLVSRTNHRRWPMCFRAFTGYRTAIHGLIFSTSLAQMMVVGMQSGDLGGRTQLLATSCSYVVVWGIALFFEFFLLQRSSNLPNTPGARLDCRECGTDLRSQAEAVRCPRCEAEVPAGVRRELARLSQPQDPAPEEAKPHPLD